MASLLIESQWSRVRERGLFTEGDHWPEGTSVIIYLSPLIFLMKKRRHKETKGLDYLAFFFGPNALLFKISVSFLSPPYSLLS